MVDNSIIINVGRQLGSGGHDIGRMLALDFGAKYYDRELMNLAAKESGFSEKYFEQNDERKGFLKGLFNVQASRFGSSNVYKSNFSQENLFQFQSDAIRKAAQEGSCVFVGRCADYVLRDFPNTVNVFISASMEYRVEQIMNKQHLDEDAARAFIEKRENERAAYYNYYTGKKWGDASSYDLCIDSSVLGLVETEKIIAQFIKKKFGEPCDEIWHAGDIGSVEVAEKLAAFRTFRAVCGNCDGGELRLMYRELNRFKVEDVDVLIKHIGGYPGNYDPSVRSTLFANPPQLFVAGHSHILKVKYDKTLNLLHINPGAAGIQGWHKERTLIRLTIDGKEFKDLEVITLGDNNTRL